MIWKIRKGKEVKELMFANEAEIIAHREKYAKTHPEKYRNTLEDCCGSAVTGIIRVKKH